MLLFDGECGFCTACAEWLCQRLERPARLVPWQWIDPQDYGLTREQTAEAVWWVEPSGRRFSGHRAVGRALLACRQPWRSLGHLFSVPGIRKLGDAVYPAVARRRAHLPGTTPACAGDRRQWEASFGALEDRGSSSRDTRS